MKIRLFKVFIVIVLSILYSHDAYATMQFENCVSADPYFDISLERSTLNRSVQSIPRLDFTVDTIVRITTDSSVTIRRIDFGLLPTMDTRINSLTDQRITDSDYLLYVNARFNDNTHKSGSVGNNLRINGIAARIMYEDTSGNLDRAYLCVPPITLRITGNQTSLPEEVDKRIKEIEKRIETAEKIQLVLAVMNLMSTFSCQEKTNELNIAKSVFEANCDGIHEVLRNITLSINDTDALCVDTDNSSALHIDNCNLCINYYNTLIALKTDTANACQRLECSDMISFVHFKNTFPGDIIGLNYCDENKDYYDDTKCEQQYRASEQPKCWLQDPVDLSKKAENPASGFNPLGFITGFDFCSDKRDPIQVIKSPANDLYSSITCGCFPGMLGWADLYLKSLREELRCVRGTTDRNLSTCSNALYTFGCDMMINALTCGGVNFGIHNNDSRFLFRHSDGSSIDMSGLTPQQIRDHINDGYTTMISGSASFNTSELIHNVCASVFGDKDVDWAETILSGVNVDSTDVISLCPSGRVRGPCYCGSDFESATINCGNTPSRNYCDFSDSNPNGECKDTPSPDRSVSPPDPVIPEVNYSDYEWRIPDYSDIPPADLPLIPPRTNSDYRPPIDSRDYYYEMPSNRPVYVGECFLWREGNGVTIRVVQGSGLFDLSYLTIELPHPGTDTTTNSVHKFHCVDSGVISSRGDHVQRTEYSLTTGTALPDSEQSVPDRTDVRANNDQIERLADNAFNSIIRQCYRWADHDEKWLNLSVIIRSFVTRKTQELASNINNYPGGGAPFTYSDIMGAREHLRDAAKRSLGDEEHDRLQSLPALGSTGFNSLSQEDKSISTCVKWATP